MGMMSWWRRRWILPPDTGGPELCPKGTSRPYLVNIIRHETQNTRNIVHLARNPNNSVDFTRHKIQSERNTVHLARNLNNSVCFIRHKTQNPSRL